MATIRVGTSGWTDETLLRCGRFYPPRATSAEARLRYYASRFSMVEVDATYYALPSRRNSTLWAQRTPERFTFGVKAFAPLTGHPIQRKSMPQEFLSKLPRLVQMQERLFDSDLPESLLDDLAYRFVDGLQPLRAAGKLGWVLLQFPPWFAVSRENARRVIQSARRLAGAGPLAVEFRHQSWASDEFLGKTVMFLHHHGLSMVSVDAPQGFLSSMPPWSLVTDPRLAVLRFHGRNSATWQDRHLTSAAQRFRYRYRHDELAELKERIDAVASEAAEVHVVMSNAHEDDAVVNASEMAAILGVTVDTEPSPEENPVKLVSGLLRSPGMTRRALLHLTLSLALLNDACGEDEPAAAPSTTNPGAPGGSAGSGGGSGDGGASNQGGAAGLGAQGGAGPGGASGGGAGDGGAAGDGGFSGEGGEAGQGGAGEGGVAGSGGTAGSGGAAGGGGAGGGGGVGAGGGGGVAGRDRKSVV